MRCTATVLVFWLLASGPALLHAQEEPELIVEIERNRIYQGESVIYRITLNHVKNPVRPKLELLEDFLVEDGGERSLNSSQITIINGRMTRIERFGMAYNYILTPRAPGTFVIPAPEVEADGRVLRGKAVTLQVLSPDDQDIVILEIETDRERVYPLQEFTITLKIYIQELPPPFQDYSPLSSSIHRSPPSLSIPWVNALAPGLIPETDWQRWISPILENRGFFFEKAEGFTINNIAASFPTEYSVFMPPHRRVTRPDMEGKETGYWEYTLMRTFSTERTGEFHFGPVNLKGGFCSGVTSNQKLRVDNIYAVGAPVTVTTIDAPEEGRPPSFTGAIGRFELSAELAPTRARVGDPITLTLRLKGKGTLDRTRPPDLEAIPGITERFKVYEATEETKGSVRTFTYSLRPMAAGIESFPPVPFSYFDVERERYVSLHTDPIPLDIEEADRLAGEDIVTQPRTDRGNNKSIEARKEGIFANISDPELMRDETVRPERYGLLLAWMALFYFLVAFLTHRIRRLSADEALQRRRSAAARGRSRLRGGIDRIREGDASGGLEKIRTALTGLVADTANLPEAGLSPRDVKERLEGYGIEQEILGRVDVLLESCDAARFGAAGTDASNLAQESERLYADLLNALRKAGRLRG